MRKFISKLIPAMLAAFTFILPISAQAAYYPGTSVTIKPGDILVTKSTSSYGLTGHAGIVISDTQGAHIRGPGYHPSTISITSWFSSYPATKVVRYSNATKAQSAANWASNYLANYYYADYQVTTNLKSLNPTYCSKIAWQAFYFGASVDITSYWNERDSYWMPTSGIVAPYDLLTANDSSVVLSKNW